MEEKIERIERFINACNDLVEGKYPNAQASIANVLAALAASRELTELFAAVAQDFDYPAAKRRYLRAPERDGARSAASLPSDRSELLAFVFCLLVELDAGALVLDDFLLRYFYVDGSYTASYTVFAERVVRPFRDIVKDCFPDLGRRRTATGNEVREEKLAKIAEYFPAERQRALSLPLRDEDRASVELIFSALMNAAGRRDPEDVLALLAGYRCLLRNVKGENETSAAIFALAAEL